MAEPEDGATQRELRTGVVAELAAVGFSDAVEIGRGGFGVVYRCREYSLDRLVALKLLKSEVRGDDREQFLREQRALGRLSGHPYILQVLHADITGTGRPYLVMPYYVHGSLQQRLQTSGPMHWPDVLSIGVKMAGALTAAHALGIVHRDLKPGNILVTDYGDPQLADFGIAHFDDATTTSTRTIQGTPAYTAPEVLGGARPETSSDIYGLGATMFSLITGHAAFARRTGEPLEVQLARIATAPRPDLREYGIPNVVCAAIQSAMATRPADRPASAIEFGERLREIQRSFGQPVDLLPTPPATPESGSAPMAIALHGRFPGTVTPPPPPIAATKFRPPTTTQSLIERPRLLQILQEGGTRRLTLIHGPAGFGKTTLAMQWAHALEAEGVPIAWLTVDTDDNNGVWFLAHLVEAIRRVRPELARELGSLLEERSSDATRYVLSSLIDEIHDSGQPVVLVVDDWHSVTSTTTIAALEFLLEHGCHHLRVVVVGRTRSGLPLTRMLVHDELIEIDATTLRFDTTEANTFLIDGNQLSLTARDVTRLCHSTEGWPAALRLASLSLRDCDDPADFIDKLTGRHHLIGEYLAENVLDSLSQPMLEFLLATSITDRISAELAAALSGRPDAQELLEAITDRNLFLQRLDDNSEWFRYHGLFADHLRRRMIRQDPDRLAHLHLLASDWFAHHDQLSAALDHAMAGGAPARAADLLESQATELIEYSRMATYLGLMAKLPASITESRPRLQLSAAWANVGMQRWQQARIAVRQALSAPGPEADGDSNDPKVDAAVVTCIEQYVTDRFDGLPELVAAHLGDAGSAFSAIARANLGAIDALHRFDFGAVRGWQEVASRYGQHHGPFVLMHSHCLTGLAAWEELDIAVAEQHFAAAVAISRRSGKGTRSSILAGALLGGLRYEQGRITEASELLEASAELTSHGGPVDFLIATFCTGARIAALGADLAAAERRLTVGAELAAVQDLPRLSAAIINGRIRIGLSIPVEARAHLRRLPPFRKQHNRIRAGIDETEHDSAIRLLLATGSAADIETACSQAELMIREIETQSRPHALVQARVRYAQCLRAAGRPEEAESATDSALSLCHEQRLPQLLEVSPPNPTAR